jgi:hypothetical protein
MRFDEHFSIVELWPNPERRWFPPAIHRRRPIETQLTPVRIGPFEMRSIHFNCIKIRSRLMSVPRRDSRRAEAARVVVEAF